MSSSIAWLDSRRQLCIGDHLAQAHHPALSIPWGSWSEADEEELHSWPTWSPGGRRVASFRVARARGTGCHVRVTENDGVSAAEVAELDGRLPIYLQWHPAGREISMLTQAGDTLRLDRASVDELGPTTTRLSGSPLFFEQTRDHLVAFVGEERGPRLAVVDRDGLRHDLAGPPGNFCAPVVLGDEVIYVVTSGPTQPARLLASNIHGGAPRELAEVSGLAALVGCPARRRLAYSIDPDGTGKSYRGVRILDPVDGSDEAVSDLPVVAFVWSSQGDALIVAERTEVGTIKWHHVGLDGFSRELVELLPTRDLRFYLRFFEQFASSHSLVDASGDHLLVAGGVLGRDDPGGTPRIWRVGLHDQEVDELTDGTFAVYSPRTGS